MAGRLWFPSDEETEEAVRAFFVVVPNDFLVVRCRVVGEVVARHFGLQFSWKLSRAIERAMAKMGAKRANLFNRQLWKRVQPRHFDVKEALELSNRLRGRKYPVGAEAA